MFSSPCENCHALFYSTAIVMEILYSSGQCDTNFLLLIFLLQNLIVTNINCQTTEVHCTKTYFTTVILYT